MALHLESSKRLAKARRQFEDAVLGPIHRQLFIEITAAYILHDIEQRTERAMRAVDAILSR